MARAGTNTIYEAAIPRKHLKPFTDDVVEFRFGVVLHRRGGASQLAAQCGVPRHYASGGSFLPSSAESFLPNQVRWGVAR